MEHVLPEAPARTHALALAYALTRAAAAGGSSRAGAWLELHPHAAQRPASDAGSAWLQPGDDLHDPRRPPRAAALFEPGGGKMFGVLLARDGEGRELAPLLAFSGMFAGRWAIDGFVEPPFSVAAWRELERQYDPGIAAWSRRLAAVPPGSPVHADALAQRREASRALAARYRALVWLHGRTGRPKSLDELGRGRALPAGTGECCAPKLLDAAHRRGLEPLALAEVFVGVHPRASGPAHASLHLPCAHKCGPLLPHLLCPRA